MDFGSRPRKTAVIGAGIAGLACAKALRSGGHRAVVFEKSRGIGGRLATRRPFGREHALGLDHGAPYAQSDDPDIAAELAMLGVIWANPAAPASAVVGTPGMSDLLRPLAEDLPLQLETEIREIARGEEDWALVDTAGAMHGPFDAVAVAAPAPQAAALLGDACPDAASARMAPCWTLLIAFEDRLRTGYDLHAPDSGPFELLIRNSDKPGRAEGYDAWVAHCRADWSAENLEVDKTEMAARLKAAFAEAAPSALPADVYCAAHRWRYARTETPVGRAFWLSEAGDLGCCGDWRLGPLAGDAYRSGEMLGRAMARKLAAG